MSVSPDTTFRLTRSGYLWTKVFKAPLWSIYCMLPFILFKELGASALEVAFLTAIKPSVSFFSFYWGSRVNDRPERLKSNIIWATFLGAVPFLCFPFVNSIPFFIASYGLFMLFHRGVIPAWMEVFKQNIEGPEREKTFASGSIVAYAADALFPFIFGPLCDSYFGAWRWIFFSSALISLFSILLQLKIPLKKKEKVHTATPREGIIKPWKEAWQLLVRRPDFRRFQMGFMLGGAGLMVMQSVLPQYVIGVLNISYTELAIALTLCKGLGVAASSHFWAGRIRSMSLFTFCASVTFVACIFPFLLFAARLDLLFLYAAHIVYGVMQSGSEMAWNLSGPIFAPNEDSSPYTGVNLLAVGLRGALAPAFAVLLFDFAGAGSVLMTGAMLCLTATLWMYLQGRSKSVFPAYSG